MEQEVYQELCYHSISISKVVTSRMVWAGRNIAILTEKGIEVLTLTYNLRSVNDNVDYTSTFIPTPKVSPAQTFLHSDLAQAMHSNLDFNELVSNPTFWAYNQQIVNEMCSFTQFQWSPPDFINNIEHALAVVTNLGYVEILTKINFKYCTILNLSEVIMRESFLEDESGHFIDMETLSKRCKTLQTSSICWGHTSENSCIFITAQRNGDIILWELKYNSEEESIADIKFKYSSFFGEVITMAWIPRTETEFLLICGGADGCIFVLKYLITDSVISVVTFQTLWPHVDYIIPRDIVYKMIDGRLVILCSKNRHIVSFLANDNCDAFEQNHLNVNEYTVMSINKALDDLYCSTVNCELFKVVVNLDNGFHVLTKKINLKENYYDAYRCNGISISPNKAIFALNLYYKKTFHLKAKVRLKIPFLYSETFHPEEVIMNHPEKKLYPVYDCVELLRIFHAKNKAITEVDTSVTLDNFDDYKAKFNYVLCIIQQTLNPRYRNIDNNIEQYYLKLKDVLGLKHAIKVMNSLFSFYQTNDRLLSYLQKEIFYGCFRFIKYFCEKYSLDLDDYTNTDIVKFVAEGIDTKINHCPFCGEILDHFVCIEGHPVQFCIVSFTQIETDEYLICRTCGATARKELYSDKPSCPLCDTHLERCFLNT